MGEDRNKDDHATCGGSGARGAMLVTMRGMVLLAPVMSLIIELDWRS